MSRTVLLVCGDAPGLAPLRRSLAAAGLEVEVAPDGFYTTLLVERRRPDAVVVPSSLPDMAARELGQILSGDPQLAAVLRVLAPLAGEPPTDPGTAEPFHLVLPPAAPPERRAMLLVAALDGRGPQALDAVDFAQLLQLLGESRLGGVLTIELPDGEARVSFHRGEVVHCAWAGLEGLPAFCEVLRASLGSGAAFRYDRLTTTAAFRLPRTIGSPVQRLLLAAAVDLDEGQGAGRRASGGGPAVG
jgi:hypothetical protein